MTASLKYSSAAFRSRPSIFETLRGILSISKVVSQVQKTSRLGVFKLRRAFAKTNYRLRFTLDAFSSSFFLSLSLSLFLRTYLSLSISISLFLLFYYVVKSHRKCGRPFWDTDVLRLTTSYWQFAVVGFARRVLPLVIPHSVAKLIDRRHYRRGNKMIPGLLREPEFSPLSLWCRKFL